MLCAVNSEQVHGHEALVDWARNNGIPEKDCNILEARGYTGDVLLDEAFKLVKAALFQDKVSRDGENQLRKFAAEINDPRSGAWSPGPPHHAPLTLHPQPPVAEEKKITIFKGESAYQCRFADNEAFATFLKNFQRDWSHPRERGGRSLVYLYSHAYYMYAGRFVREVWW